MHIQKLLLIVVCLLAFLSRDVAAQAKSEFEVASIRPAAPDARGTFIRPGPGGGISLVNMTLKDMILIAWRVQPFQISGGPSWLDSARYDVTAKPEAPANLNPMLQSLLQDRFQLAFHRETKELPIYALVLARKQGKLGPGLTESDSCTPPDPTKPAPRPKLGEPATLGCGGMIISARALTAASVPVGNLASSLSRLLGRMVVDKTGLTGKFNIQMEWSPDEAQGVQPAPVGPTAPTSDTAAPSLFTALQEQLGLKLESQKGPVEILFVDRADKPSEN